MKYLQLLKQKFSDFKKNESKRNAVLALLGNLLYSVLGFLGIAILARALSLNEYGSWVIYLTASSLFEMMRIGFLHTALVRYSSGVSYEVQRKYIGSGWIIGLLFTFIFSILLFLTYAIVAFYEIQTPYNYFLKYYPLLAIINLPSTLSLSILQFRMQFGKLLVFRFFTMTINLSVFIAAYFFDLKIETVILLHLASNLFASLFSIFMNYSGISFIKYFEKQKVIDLIQFGKFSLGTLIGTNLLKSADTFILGLVSGTDSAALYSIPLKLTETFEVLLRSIVSVALPKMSNYSVKSQYNEVKRVFQSYSGLLTLIYVPAMAICFIFAELLLQILGGPEFVNMANVFRMFCLYGLLLPIDRFTGVTLDCINRPNLNFKKVLVMALFNVLFDIIALQFSSDLIWIAFGSVLTTLLGIIIGLRFLNTLFETSFRTILESGYSILKKAYL